MRPKHVGIEGFSCWSQWAKLTGEPRPLDSSEWKVLAVLEGLNQSRA